MNLIPYLLWATGTLAFMLAPRGSRIASYGAFTMGIATGLWFA